MKPNILFILADQHNAKVLGYRGHPDVKTPNLDRMAAEGVRFSDAVTQNPICTPSRMCFLSGQYCHNHGYYGLSGPNPGGLPTVFGHFRRHGYFTGAVGKIHCPEYWVEDDCDVFHETCGCSIGGRSPKYTAFLRDRGKEDLEDHGRMPEFGERGRQNMDSRPSALAFDECQEGWIANEIVALMSQARQAGKPFFLHASLPRPHQCTSPCRAFWDLYEGMALTLPPNADSELAGQAPHLVRAARHWRQGQWALLEPKTFEAARLRKLRGYLAAITQVDAGAAANAQRVLRYGHEVNADGKFHPARLRDMTLRNYL
ncbi:MAG: sulfatase-like hydrolase/transferase [Kiritimatiellae bacterium]|nr:sulfatase-like hydrolase/transferase [Kiritimatiellia bacterium]